MLMPGQHSARGGLRSRWRSAAGGLAAAAVALAGAGPAWATASVYVTIGGDLNDPSPGGVSMFDVGAGGRLSAKTPATVATGLQPQGVAVSPDGRSVYVTNTQGPGISGVVSMFDVGAGGRLSPKAPATVPVGSGPNGIAVSPDGRSVYVANSAKTWRSRYYSVWMFDVGARGVLSPKKPVAVAAGTAPQAVVVSPDGRSVYVTNQGWDGPSVESLPVGSVSMFDVGAGGVLSAKKPAAVAAGYNPHGVALSADGRSVYVANSGDPDRSGPDTNTVSMFDVRAGGVLSAKTPATVEAGVGPWGVAVSPDGRSVYVANRSSGSVSMFDAGARGVLSGKEPPEVALPADSGPNGIAVSPDARSVYVTNSFSNTVSMLSVGARGVLAAKTPAEVRVGGPPSGIAVTPLPVRLTGLGISPATFAAARQSTPVAAAARGATIRWTLSRDATTTIRFFKQTDRPPRPGPKPIRRLTRTGRAGANVLRFTGRIAGSALTPGTWKLTVTARDSSGSTTRPQSRFFRIVKG